MGGFVYCEMLPSRYKGIISASGYGKSVPCHTWIHGKFRKDGDHYKHASRIKNILKIQTELMQIISCLFRQFITLTPFPIPHHTTFSEE